MSFTKAGLSPVMERVVEDILSNNGETMQVNAFRKDLYRMRMDEELSNMILKHLQEKGYIIRRGKTIIII